MLRFYGGKGGVGKTTCAAAAALALSRKGKRTLVVSTDPAHSLADALEAKLSASPRAVRGRLHAAEMDADRALSRWMQARERVFRTVASRGTYLDDEDIDALFRLSLPGVDELIGLIELRRLSRGFDEVVVDTAPTGHTLRLLSMPATLKKLAQVLDDLQAKHRAIAASLRGSVRKDAADALIEELQEDARGLDALLRSADAEFHWVTLAEDLSLAEARDGIGALRAGGQRVTRLIANRLTPQPDRPCAFCSASRADQARVLAEARDLELPIHGVPDQEEEPRGAGALAAIADALAGAPLRASRTARAAQAEPRPLTRPGPPDWLGSIAPPGTRLLFFGGKGGVGKTTAAAAAAVLLARRGTRVLLLSTDPAHSLGDVLRMPVGDEEREVISGLRARELDAARAFGEQRERHRKGVEELFATLRGGSSLDAPYDRAVMEDLIDLAPPGLDELFALLAVIEALARHQLIVVDTAPTGHALRLLELAGTAREWVQALLQILLKYRRVTGLGTVAQDLTTTARELRELQELLQDPGRARFVAVTRPAALPRLETARLLAALRRLRMKAAAVLVNARTGPGCRRCRRAGAAEEKEIAQLRRIRRGWAMLGAPRVAPGPRGPAALERFGSTWTSLS
ncbi:MAG TPA: ArsA family ATPase [Myxococcales bacterium]|nr:ArsA family ATPase [Myxococcales bacterium]